MQAFTTRPETIYGVTFLALGATHQLAGKVDTLEAHHPLTGETLPVVVAPYIVGDYGTGVVMGVPGHDQRDHDLATAMSLPIRTVIRTVDGIDTMEESGPLSGESATAAASMAVKLLRDAGAGEDHTTFRLVSKRRKGGRGC